MSRVLIVIALCALMACQSAYDRDLDQWRSDRFAEVKSPYGWPSVVGLYPIRVTYSYFGGSDRNEFIVPNAPSSFGYLERTDTAIVMKAYTNMPIYIEGKKTHKAILRSDRHPDGPTLANYKSLQWHIIERSDQYYLRVKDTLSAYRTALNEIPYFPPSERYIVDAKVVEPSGRPDSITYVNILGQSITRAVAAHISFEWEGETHELAALNNGESSYYLMIQDKTTGISSYGGGRYLYPPKEDNEGNIVLDFNKLINPPCVFTPYATCPLPPKTNHLPFEIKAGEKDVHLY